jgi:peptidoglycan/xylan/chitin deacetylase (PgdA/CDA1 family)
MICLTHDVDGPFIRNYPGLFNEIVRRPLDLSPREILDSARLRLARKLNWFFLPRLLEIERRHGVRSTFFFRVDEERYVIDDFFRSVICGLDSEGFEIGLHASISSAFKEDLLRKEKERLEEVLGHPIRGVRHHYLTLRDSTWDSQRSVGFEYDSTLGNRNDVSFIQPFVLPSGLRVFPMCLMDSSDSFMYQPLSKYFAFIDEALNLIKKDGLTFTVLFHADHFGYRQERLTYEYLLYRSKRLGVEVAPLGVASERYC